MSFQYIFAGLGNPGAPYRGTRHNAGSACVEELARRNRISLGRAKYRSFVGQGTIAGQPCLLALPQTYMNLSGQAIKRMLRYTQTPVSRLVVVHDDIDLSLGRIRLRCGGGGGGHRGVRSIMDSLQQSDFIRLKIGVGRPPAGEAAEEYVLGRLRRSEYPLLAQAIENASHAAETLVSQGVDKAMSRFNAPQ